MGSLRFRNIGYLFKAGLNKHRGRRLHPQTNPATRQDVFDVEYQQILAGRKPPPIVRRDFLLRCPFLTVVDGDIRYILRGLH